MTEPSKRRRQATARGRMRSIGEWVGGRGWISHAYSRKYSRMKHFGASLTLNASYSLFSQSPVAKQHSVVLLGRLPTSLSSGKKERVNVSYNIVDRRSWARTMRHCFATLNGEFAFCFTKKQTSLSATSCAIMMSCRFEQNKRKEKQKRATVWLLSFVWLPLLGLNQRHHD